MAGTSFGKLILTNSCDALTAEAWATSGILQVTAIQGGSGFPGVHDNPETYTGLKDPVMYGIITGINDIIPGQLTVRGNFSSANAPNAFNLNEVGIFANVAGGVPQLVAYATTGANNGQTLDPTGMGSPYIADFAFLCIFNQAVITSGIIQLVQVVGVHADTHLSLDPTTGEPGIDMISLPTLSSDGMCPASLTGTGDNYLVDTVPPSYSPIPPIVASGTPVLVNGDLRVNQGFGLGTFADNWKKQTTSGFSASATLEAWDNSFTPDAWFQIPPAFVRLQATANNSGPGANDYCQVTTAIEGCDFLTSYGNDITVSALIRGSASGQALVLISSGGTTTRYTAFVCDLTTSFQRFYFTISSWPTSAVFNINQQNQVAVYLSVLGGGGANYSLTSFDTSGWSTAQGSGSAWGLLRTNSAYIDVADCRWDVSSTIALPIFESFGTTLFRCMRYQQELSFFGIAFSPTFATGEAQLTPIFGATPVCDVTEITDTFTGASPGGFVPGPNKYPSGVNGVQMSAGANISQYDAITANIICSNLLF